MASSHGIYVMQRFRWNASNALFMDREPVCIEEVWASIQQVGTSSLGPGLMGEMHRRMCVLGTGEGHTPESPHNIPRWVAVHARKDFSMETSPPAPMFGQAAKDPPLPISIEVKPLSQTLRRTAFKEEFSYRSGFWFCLLVDWMFCKMPSVLELFYSEQNLCQCQLSFLTFFVHF